MPKIAASVSANAQLMRVKFYWHLGDFRALYRMDCDWAKRKDEAIKCAKDYVPYQSIPKELEPTPEYLDAAWQDFVDHQVAPFEKAGIPVYLGIGNHELIKRTRDDYAAKFNKWLVQSAIGKQQKTDAKRKIPPRDSQTYFHFAMRGVDFISLDNANLYNEVAETKKPDPGFSNAQLKWLAAILKADAANPAIRSVVVGMHAALPGVFREDMQWTRRASLSVTVIKRTVTSPPSRNRESQCWFSQPFSIMSRQTFTTRRNMRMMC
jgi:hypothetical protein